MEVFVGTIVHSTEENPMMIRTDCVIGVQNSKIVFLENEEKLGQLKADYGFTEEQILHLNSSQFIMPGFIDTHIHASQYPNNGLSIGVPLLEWLEKLTFPTEASYLNPAIAKNVYEKVVNRLLRNGTTTAVYFATIHLEATKILADIVNDKGQRALVGKVNQIVNSLEYYKEMNVEESVKDTEEFILYVKNLQNDLVLPIVTPRFAITCPEDQMLALGRLAQKYDCHIQSHLCETKSEIKWTKQLFPWSKSYTQIYDSMGLLTKQTVMAHCVWMTEEELVTIHKRGSGISHCPNSNLSLKSGICDSRRLLSHGINVGLGTDCSGGYSSSMLDAMRLAVHSSHIIGMDKDEKFQPLTMEEAFQLATLGGAKVLNLDHKIGNFCVNKEFDALVIDSCVPGSPFDIFPEDTIEGKVKKFLFNGDDRNISRVYVSGKRILHLND